jgi:hypothetical protein
MTRAPLWDSGLCRETSTKVASKAVQMIIQVGILMRGEHEVAKPFLIPPILAYQIVLALRGERTKAAADADGIPVPG